MKAKGISIIEQHVEKIVLGATVVVAGGLLAMQFVMNPNAVEFDRDSFAPADVDGIVQTRANRLQGRLDSDTHIEFSQDASLSEWFREQHTMAYGDAISLAHPIVRPTPLQLGEASAITGSIGLYAEFVPSAPTEMRVVARPYTLSENILQDNPELADGLPENAPYDIGVVHIFAQVNGDQLRQTLLAPAEERNAIPSAWWDQYMEIMDIVVERQRRFADGTWSATEFVPVMPGQTTVRAQMMDATALQTSSIMNEVFTAEESLYRPPFYNLMGDEPWTEALVKELEPLTEEEEQAVGMMKRAWNELVTAQRQLERYENREKSRNSRGPGDGGGPTPMGEGGGEGKGRGGGYGGSGSDDREKDREQRTMDRLVKRVEDSEYFYETEKQNVMDMIPTYDRFPDEEPVEDRRTPGGREGGETDEQSYEQMMGGEGAPRLGGEGYPSGGKGERGGYSERGRGGRADRARGRGKRDTLALLDDEEREVWLHDINIVPGAVYRYRMRVDYYNPFFGKAERLAEEQRSLAEKMYLSSEYTDWGEPINVVSTKQFYAVGGSYNELVTERRASIEVYVYTGGAQRMAVMSVRPGEPIGEVKTFNVLDTSEDEEEDDPRDRGRDRGRDAQNDDVETYMEVEVDFATGAVLLDVIEIEEGLTTQDRKVQVLVALEDGSIVALDPEQQRGSDDRRRLRELATKEPKS